MSTVGQIDRAGERPPLADRHQVIDVVPTEPGAQCLGPSGQAVLDGGNGAKQFGTVHTPKLAARPPRPPPLWITGASLWTTARQPLSIMRLAGDLISTVPANLMITEAARPGRAGGTGRAGAGC